MKWLSREPPDRSVTLTFFTVSVILFIIANFLLMFKIIDTTGQLDNLLYTMTSAYLGRKILIKTDKFSMNQDMTPTDEKES